MQLNTDIKKRLVHLITPMPLLQFTDITMEDLAIHSQGLKALDWSDFPKLKNKTRAQTTRICIEQSWVRFLYHWN